MGREMTIAESIAQLEAELTAAKSRVSTLEQQVAYQQGRIEQQEQINGKLQATLSLRETALALYEAARHTNEIQAMPRPAEPEPQRLSAPIHEAPPGSTVTPMHPSHPDYVDEPMPAFIRAQIPKVADRRRSA